MATSAKPSKTDMIQKNKRTPIWKFDQQVFNEYKTSLAVITPSLFSLTWDIALTIEFYEVNWNDERNKESI